MAQDGGLVDVHITAFISSIDSLLATGRSNAPTHVLIPMKAVVTSTSAIIEDVRTYESQPSRTDVDIDALHSLRERTEATLSNLVAVSKTHATSLGMSPVSLLDAAASHVSSTVTEIAKMIFIRKATRMEQEFSSSPQPQPQALRSLEDLWSSSNHSRQTSNGSSRNGELSGKMMGFLADRRDAAFADPSNSNASTPPPAFDRSLGGSGYNDQSAPTEGGEDAWSELKVCDFFSKFARQLDNIGCSP